jgi:hypothetical protein
MIQPTDLRAALAAPNPYAALDSLVRGELAAGLRTQAVYDRLMELVPEAEGWPEYTPTADDAVTRVMDALSGWCHPDWQYRDVVSADSHPPGSAGRATQHTTGTSPAAP